MKKLQVSKIMASLGVLILMPLFSLTNSKSNNMQKSENLGLYVILNAKPEKATEVKEFLMGGFELAKQEQGTVSWYAFQVNETTFGIFDTFEDEAGRDAHLNGDIAKALLANAEELLVDFEVSHINKLNIIAAK